MDNKKDLEDVERLFIVGGDAEKEDYVKLIKRLVAYARVDSSGYVIIEENINKKATLKDRALLVLAARYLASKLQEKLGKEVTINAEVSADELAKMSNSTKEVIMARAKELKDARKLIPANERGTYVILAYCIKDFLNRLDNISGHIN